MELRPGMVVRTKKSHNRHEPGPAGSAMVDRAYVRLEEQDTLLYIRPIDRGLGHEFKHMRTGKTIHAFVSVSEHYFEEVK